MTEQLRIRDESPLVSHDVVVRSGSMVRSTLERAVTNCALRYGVWGLSVAARRGASVVELYASSSRLRLDERHCEAEAGEILLTPGFDLIPSGASPHYTLVLPGPLTDESTWQALRGVFSPIRQAPQWGA